MVLQRCSFFFLEHKEREKMELDRFFVVRKCSHIVSIICQILYYIACLTVNRLWATRQHDPHKRFYNTVELARLHRHVPPKAPRTLQTYAASVGATLWLAPLRSIGRTRITTRILRRVGQPLLHHVGARQRSLENRTHSNCESDVAFVPLEVAYKGFFDVRIRTDNDSKHARLRIEVRILGTDSLLLIQHLTLT